MLELADSSVTYRSRYTLVPNIAAVYDMVLLDGTNPRSLLFQLLQLEKHFDRLPKEFIFERELLRSRLWRSPERWELAHEDVVRPGA